MTYLVFDARKATGYLFETRHKWLAHWFCAVAEGVKRLCYALNGSLYGWPMWDYENAFDFEAGVEPWTGEEAELVRDIMREEAELDWREVYGS